MPHTAYIVDAVRTPAGKRKGALSESHPSDLGGFFSFVSDFFFFFIVV